MRFDKKQIIYASLVFGWISLFWTVYDQLIQSINAYSFGLSSKQGGYILAIDNILGLFVLPLFGKFSDNCKSKLGRRTPFIIIGTAVSMLGFLFVGIFASQRLFIPYIISLFITLFAMAAYRPAGLALVPDLVTEEYRNKANSISNLVSVVFTIFAVVLPMVLMPLKFAKAGKFLPVTVGVIALTALTFLVFMLKFNEKKALADFDRQLADLHIAAPEKNVSFSVAAALHKKANLFDRIMVLLSLFFFYIAYNALVSNFTVYSDVILHFSIPQLPMAVVMVGALPGFIVAIKVADKLGRNNTVIVGFGIMMLSFIGANFFTSSLLWQRALLLICFTGAGFGFGFVIVNLYPYYLELSGKNEVGQSTGEYAGVMTAAMVLTPILAGYIIELVGKSTNTSYTINQIINGESQSVTLTGDYRVLLPYCATAMGVATLAIVAIQIRQRVMKIKIKAAEDVSK